MAESSNGKNSGRVHLLKAGISTTHTGFFDETLSPALQVESGDTVVFDTLMLQDDRLSPNMTIEEISQIRATYRERGIGGHTLTGPIYVSGVDKGDILVVHTVKLACRPYGVMFNEPKEYGTGAVPDLVPEGHVRGLRIDNANGVISFAPGITLLSRPFLGCMGVAPQGGRVSSAAPGPHGGNLDCKELTEGSMVYFPVFAKGALFSAGDAHATQGDGECCLTAVETAFSEVVLTLKAMKSGFKKFTLQRPIAETDQYWITFGFDKDLDEAVQTAVKDMINLLESVYELKRAEAYHLCSVAVDLAITQVVNPRKGVHAKLPKNIFVSDPNM
jgi:acetamidase/formamidase